MDEVRVWNDALTLGEIGESFALGDAANNASYDTIVKHKAGSVFVFTSAFHNVDDGDTIKFRVMRVDSTATIDDTVLTNGITARCVTPNGGTWTLDSVVDGLPADTERNIDPDPPGGTPTATNLALTANLDDGTSWASTCIRSPSDTHSSAGRGRAAPPPLARCFGPWGGAAFSSNV